MALQKFLKTTVYLNRALVNSTCTDLLSRHVFVICRLPGISSRVLSTAPVIKHVSVSQKPEHSNSMLQFWSVDKNNWLQQYDSKQSFSILVKRFYSENKPEETPEKKLSLYQRFKHMYRDYWYVLVPVHLVTSAGWFGCFYYLAKSGVDMVAVLEYMGVCNSLIAPLKDSNAGYLAISYAMYKIATPIRYTVTLGGTTLSIKYLKQWGMIKPIPPREKLKEMYSEKRETIREKADVFRNYCQRRPKKE